MSGKVSLLSVGASDTRATSKNSPVKMLQKKTAGLVVKRLKVMVKNTEAARPGQRSADEAISAIDGVRHEFFIVRRFVSETTPFCRTTNDQGLVDDFLVPNGIRVEKLRVEAVCRTSEGEASLGEGLTQIAVQTALPSVPITGSAAEVYGRIVAREWWRQATLTHNKYNCQEPKSVKQHQHCDAVYPLRCIAFEPDDGEVLNARQNRRDVESARHPSARSESPLGCRLNEFTYLPRPLADATDSPPGLIQTLIRAALRFARKRVVSYVVDVVFSVLEIPE
ncbi:hypothetical protein LTR03_017934 [Friedmanniomyces endolithicus]|nr:hypothetical protein LTR03_017934 [Friedmanniomyces endolithicus]